MKEISRQVAFAFSRACSYIPTIDPRQPSPPKKLGFYIRKVCGPWTVEQGFSIPERRSKSFKECSWISPRSWVVLQPGGSHGVYSVNFWRFCPGPCLPDWLAACLAPGSRSETCISQKAGDKPRLSLLRIRRPFRSRRQLCCSTKEWNPWSYEAHVEPLSLRWGADPALHLH